MPTKKVKFEIIVDGEPVDVAPVSPPFPSEVATTRRKKAPKWPLACATCKGTGDVPLTEEDLDEDLEDQEVPFCKACMGRDKCPRCAESLPQDWKELIKDIDEYLTCEHCGWEDGDDPVI